MKKKELKKHIQILQTEIVRLKAENEQLERALLSERSNIQRIVIWPTQPYTPQPPYTYPPDTGIPLTPPFIVTC